MGVGEGGSGGGRWSGSEGGSGGGRWSGSGNLLLQFTLTAPLKLKEDRY
ncbi:unnamed protein product [Camellia sinensis]